MSESHNYTNPSKKQDLAHVEAVSDKKYDEDGNESVSYTHLTLPTKA